MPTVPVATLRIAVIAAWYVAGQAGPGRAVSVGALSRVLLGGTAVLGALAFTWPLFIDPGSALAADTTAPLVLAGILPLLLGLVVVQLTNAELDVKTLSMLGVLTAMGAVARPLGAGRFDCAIFAHTIHQFACFTIDFPELATTL